MPSEFLIAHLHLLSINWEQCKLIVKIECVKCIPKIAVCEESVCTNLFFNWLQ